VLLHSPAGFGQILFGRLAELPAWHTSKIAEVDCFAAASGPGSFTGARIGPTSIKGLAEATGKPAVGVSNLAANSHVWLGCATRRGAGCAPRRWGVFACERLRAGQAADRPGGLPR